MPVNKPCSNPRCAGCYEVAPGVRLHPPKNGKDFIEWNRKWKKVNESKPPSERNRKR